MGDKDVKINGMPLLKLNLTNKIYLAVARRKIDKLILVYTLSCARRAGTNSYEVTADKEVAAFNSQKKADIYFDTISAIVDDNMRTKNFSLFFDFNRDAINLLHQNVK